MATKSTKFRNSEVFKVIIILLSCVFMFEGAFSLQKLVNFYYNNTEYAVNGGFTLTPRTSVLGGGNSRFFSEATTDINNVEQLCNTYINDDAVADGSAFESIEKNLRKQMEEEIADRILIEKKDVIDGLYTYDEDKEEYTYSGAQIAGLYILDGFSSGDQVLADQTSDGITTIDGIQYYKGFPLNGDTIDFSKAEADIRSEVEYDYNARIISRKAAFKSNYANLKEHLASLKNFSYYVVNKVTGEVYTNIDVKTVSEAAKNMDEFSVSLINGDMEISSEISKSYYGLDGDYDYDTSYSASWGYTDLFNNNLDPEVYDAYFHVNTSESTIVDGDNYKSLYANYVESTSDFEGNVAFFVSSFFLWIVCMIILGLVAGMTDEEGRTKLTGLDKIPNSIHFILSAGIVSLLFAADIGVYWNYGYIQTSHDTNRFWWLALASFVGVLGNIVFVEWLMSVVRQCRNKQFFRNTITYLLIIKNYRKIKIWFLQNFRKITDGSIKRKVYGVLICFAMLMAIFAMFGATTSDGASGFAVIMIIAITLFAIVYVRRGANALDDMLGALSQAEKGKFDYKVDVSAMPEPLKPLGDKTNNLTKGIEVAVDKAVKGERMKTELITNVSHDLKTPLTSIITYVDLLKHCNIRNEQALEYIGVLDEKSNRLKKLIEDLVEASKASSGNVTLNLTDINLNEMAEQIFGENEDTFTSMNLELKQNLPSEPIIVRADGQKTYRVIENLFSNIRKYALPATRVYMDIERDDNFAKLSIKNVSRDELNVDVSKLTERFVRGDESRTTEGSGLGLSIAKSLTELQGGKFEILVDGDLFKVVVRLPIAPNAPIKLEAPVVDDKPEETLEPAQ